MVQGCANSDITYNMGQTNVANFTNVRLYQNNGGVPGALVRDIAENPANTHSGSFSSVPPGNYLLVFSNINYLLPTSSGIYLSANSANSVARNTTGFNSTYQVPVTVDPYVQTSFGTTLFYCGTGPEGTAIINITGKPIGFIRAAIWPATITAANGFSYTGTPLKATLGGASTSPNVALLTTDGLYTWGGSYVIPWTVKVTNSSTTAFSKVTVNGKTDGLPAGVSPSDVKMMFGTLGSLSIVTCKGEAWNMNTVAGTTGNIYLYGDGTQVSTANNNIWHRVMTSATETLDNVVAVRGSAGAKFALTAEGNLYTWGQGTYIGDGSDLAATGTNRAFATEVVVPNGITPKMIGMTEGQAAGKHTYYVLATNGKLYAMGDNTARQLGDGTTTNSNVWKEVTATSAGQTLGGNIAWISPSEHGNDVTPTINVLTSDKKQWGWGDNFSYKLGQTTATHTAYNPTYMPGNTTNADGMGQNDEVIALETGGRFTMNYKKNSQYFGFVGQYQYGTIGNGTTGAGNYYQKYNYNTAIVNICSASDTPAAPFTCDTKFYLTQYGPAATDKTILYTLDNTTNPFTKTVIGESPAGMKVNGIGYNTSDNFIYGMRTEAANANHMVRIDANGVFTDLGAVTGLPAGGFNSGGFDNSGNYYIINFDSNNLYKINVATNTATPVTLSRNLKVSDIAYDPISNLFYGYESSSAQLVSITTAGVVSNVGSPSALGNVFFGAMYSDANGDIFGNEDDGSGFYQFNKTTGQATKISESISAYGNDGANCPSAVIKFPADLSITKTDGKTQYIPGTSNVYTIVVSNNSGAYGVLGAKVSDPVPAGIPAANVSYSVPVLTGGATTSITGPQTGALNDVVGLPIGGTITYTITINVPISFNGNLTNTVTVMPPANSTDPDMSNNTATDTDTNGVCYKPGITTGTALDTKVGITALGRAGVNADNWPMLRKGGWIALESKTKAFVPNRVAFSAGNPVGIDPANFVEGMMVFDTIDKCMKMYTQKAGEPSMAWHCISTQTCPD